MGGILSDTGEKPLVMVSRAWRWRRGGTASGRGWRVGKPYAVDVSRPVRAGKNHLWIVVTNSEDNKWAVWPWRDNLKNIRINGLMGPVRIVPYLDETMVGKKQ